MIKHNLFVAVLCLFGLLGLTITTSGLAFTPPPPPLHINTTPTAPLTPEELTNGLTVYDSTLTTQDDPLVILDDYQNQPFIVKNNGIQLGATVNHHGTPINGRLYLDGRTTTAIISSNYANVQVSGSGTPAIMDQCTYLSTNCSILQVGPDASLGTSDAPMGDVSISAASSQNTQATYGKLLIQGSAYVNNIKIGTSDNIGLMLSHKHSSGFGSLEVVGSNTALMASLDANKIYLPGESSGSDFSSSLVSGYGVMKIGPYATITANQLILGQQISDTTPYLTTDNQVTVQGPDSSSVVKSGGIQIANVANKTSTSLPIDINILDGARLETTGGISIKGPNILKDLGGNLATISIASTNPSEISQINVNNGTFSMEGSVIDIGNPKGTQNTAENAELNIDSVGEGGVKNPNVIFSGDSTVNIYPQGIMSIPNTSAITMNNNANIYVNGGRLSITGENTSLSLADNASITVAGGDVTIGNPENSSTNVVMSNKSTLSVGIYGNNYFSSTVTINGTLKLASNSIIGPQSPVIVKPTGQLNVTGGIIFSGTKQFIILEQAFGKTAKLFVPTLLDQHNIECQYPRKTGGTYLKEPNATKANDGILYSCTILVNSDLKTKPINTQQLNNAFGNSAK